MASNKIRRMNQNYAAKADDYMNERLGMDAPSLDKLYQAFQEIEKKKQRKKEESNDLDKLLSSTTPSQKPKKDDNQTGIFEFLGGSVKNAFQGFNPLDDVSMKQAFESQMSMLENPSNSLDQLNRTATRGINSATLGGLDLADKKLNDRDYEYLQNKEGFDVSDLGAFAGYFAPGALAANALRGTRLGANLTPGMSQAARFGQRAKEGAVLGAGLSGVEEGMSALSGDGFNFGNVALNTGLGALADPLLGMGLDKLFKPKNVNLPEGLSNQMNQSQELLGLPNTGNIRLPQPSPLGLNVPLNRGKAQSEPPPVLGLEDGSIPKMDSTPYGDIPMTETRGNGLPRSHWEAKLNKFSQAIQGVDLPSGREKETLEELWTHFADPNDPKLEDVIELATPSLDEVNRYSAGQQGEPLQFRQTKVGRPPQQETDDFLSFTSKNERPFSSTKVEGSYSTTPTDRGVRVNSSKRPDDNLKFKKTVIRDEMFDFLGDKPKGPTSSNPNKPLGFKAGTIDEYANSPIAGPRTTATKIKDGRVSLKQTLQDFKQMYSSNLQVAKDIDQTLHGKKIKDILVGDSWYKNLRAVGRSQAMAYDYTEKTMKPILESLNRNNLSKIDFEEYALAKHAEDIMRTNSEYQLPKSVTPEWVNRTLAKWNGNKTMEKAQKDLVKLNQQMLRMLQKEGVYSKKDVDNMMKAHPNYISMKRDVDKLESLFGASANKTKAKKHIKGRKDGSEDDVLSPIETTIQNIHLTMANSLKNKAMKKVEKLAKMDKDGLFFRKMEPYEDVVGKNIVNYFENGKKVSYEVSDAVAVMVKNLDEKQTEGIFKAAQFANQILRKGATHYNLDFIIKSPVRDTQTAMVTSRTGAKLQDMTLGFLDSLLGKNIEKITGGKLKSYRDFYQNEGGFYTGLISMDSHDVDKLAKKMLKNSKVEYVNPLRFIEKIGEIVEHSQKLGEFRSAKRKGYSDEDAMFEAVDVIDYTEAGAHSKEINKVVSYFNAAIRGNVRLLQAFKENPGKATSRAFMYVTVPTIANYFASRYAPWVSEEQKKKLDNLQDWEKNLFWHVSLPGTDKLVPLPKAHVLGQTFANIPERILDSMIQENPKAWEGYGKELAKSLAPPTGIPLVLPLVEVGTNHNFFFDMPIVDDEMARKKPEDQFNFRTSELAKGLGSAIGNSPAKIDHVIKGMTGGVGKQVLGTSDEMLRQLGVADRPTPEKPVSDSINPIKRNFVRNDSRSSGQSSEIYELYGELNDMKLAERDNIKNKLREQNPSITNKQLTDLLRDGYEFKYEDQLKAVTQIKDAISKIGREIKNIRMNKEMDPSVKKQKIEELRAKERNLNQVIRDKGYVESIRSVLDN